MNTANTYDELKYYSKAFSFCNVAHLESQGYLWGLTPPAIEGARVLELGSSFGGNLISQALYYPNTEFVGIDLSATQINQGNEIIRAMELNNITLLEKNILDINADFGKFDYIIVHGIYSWVPDIVKDKILAICRENLSENGLAYVSYNTYPGWKNKDVARDMMLFANKYEQNLSLLEKNRRGKIVTKLFLDTINELENIKSKNIARFQNYQDILEKDDHYVAHEYLETFNNPIYLHEFVERAQSHQLAYVGDISLQLSYISWMPKNAQEMVRNLVQNQIGKEQCIDYIYDTEFRRSLLCRAENAEFLNHSEEVPKALLNRYTYLLNKDVNLNSLINDANLLEILNGFQEKNLSFTIQSIIDYIEEKQLTEKIPLNNIYSSLLFLIILGNVIFYITPYPTSSFEENKSYVPQKFIRYVDIMLQGAIQFISFADMYNRNLFFIDDMHYFIMQQLATPKNKTELVESLKTYFIQTQPEKLPTDENLIQAVNTVCNNLGDIGYLVQE